VGFEDFCADRRLRFSPCDAGGRRTGFSTNRSRIAITGTFRGFGGHGVALHFRLGRFFLLRGMAADYLTLCHTSCAGESVNWSDIVHLL
jgi:hypothetical protein